MYCKRNSLYPLETLGKYVGEQDAEELEYSVLNPETRTIYQLTVSDIEKTEKMFEDLYGKKVEPRVDFLLSHLEEVEGEELVCSNEIS